MSAAVVRVAGVGLRYRRTVALADIDLELPGGTMIGFIGPDGVGKSSLLALIAGARKIQQGSVQVLGGDMADPRHRSDVCPRIAYMPQGLGKNLYATLSVVENLDFFGRLFGQPRAERGQRIDELLRRDRPGGVSRPAGRQALRRHAAEARPVLCAHPRPGPAYPGRADHRSGSAVPQAVLGADRPHPRAPAPE